MLWLRSGQRTILTAGIIDLLRAFYAAMMERKAEMQNKLNGKLGSDFTDFRLPAYIFLMDEYAAFQASISRDKKRCDEVEEIMRNIVLMGRQLGFRAPARIVSDSQF